MNKEQAIKEVRRRVETETNQRQRVKLLVLEKAIETDLMIESVGEIVDVSGEVFGYASGLLYAGAKAFGDPLAHIYVVAIDDAYRDDFARFAKDANNAFKVLEHEKEACLKLIYAYLGVSG